MDQVAKGRVAGGRLLNDDVLRYSEIGPQRRFLDQCVCMCAVCAVCAVMQQSVVAILSPVS